MLVQTTTAGQAILAASPLNTLVTSVRLGSSFGYQLPLNPAGLTGTQVYLYTVTLSPIPGSNNSIKYQIVLDDSIGNFTFGEVAFYVGATLLAVGVLSGLVNKVKNEGQVKGNKVKIEGYIDLGANVRFSFGDISLSSSKDLIPRIPNVDLLPQIDASIPSLISVYSNNNIQPFVCHSDGIGRWALESKPTVYHNGVITLSGVSGLSSTLIGTAYNGQPSDLVIQFTNGKGRSICRRVTSYSLNGNIQWSTPIVENLPAVGDEFIILGPSSLVSTPVLTLPPGNFDGDFLVWDNEDSVYRILSSAGVINDQVLLRDSNKDLGVKWATLAPSGLLPPGTSDGDILIWDNEDSTYRPLLATSAPSGHVLTRDTSLDLGVKWAALPSAPIFTLPPGATDGDILVWDNEDSVYRPLPTALVPTGYVLTRDTALDLGVKWAPAATGGGGSQSITILQKPQFGNSAATTDGYSYLLFSNVDSPSYYRLEENYINEPVGWWVNLANKTAFALSINIDLGSVIVKPGFLTQVTPGGTATLINIGSGIYHLFGDLVLLPS